MGVLTTMGYFRRVIVARSGKCGSRGVARSSNATSVDVTTRVTYLDLLRKIRDQI